MSSYENFILIFRLYKMVNSKNNFEKNIPLKISIETTTKNPEMLNFIPGHLKTKKMCKKAIKKCRLY